jgi:UDP-GlcNAc:undecaprenyl-phosphate GlcNAc-1-phosphate transferase
MWILVYIYIFSFAVLLSALLIPIVRKIAIRFSILDQSEVRKSKPVPLLGGIAIYTSFILTVIINLGILSFLKTNPELLALLPEVIAERIAVVEVTYGRLTGILLGGTSIMVLGLIDDIKELSPKIKLSGQLFATLFLVLFGVRLTLFLPIYLAVPITILWVVGITNAFNLLDNMDGLSSGVALIASLIFLVVALTAGQYLVSVILIAFIGTILGFLRHNFHPATIFMGDAGSQFIGFLLASLTILSTFYTEGAPTHLPVVMPLLILGVPLFDTASVVLIRLKKKVPIFKGDKRHLSHRLLNLGMTQPQAVLFIYLLTFCVGINAILLRDVGWGGAFIILFQVLAVLGLIVLLEVVKARKGHQSLEHQSTSHQLPITNYQSPITNHQLPVTRTHRAEGIEHRKNGK